MPGYTQRGRRSVACAPFVHLLCSYTTAHVSISAVRIEEDGDDLPYAMGIKQTRQSIAIVVVGDVSNGFCVTVVVLFLFNFDFMICLDTNILGNVVICQGLQPFSNRL